MKSLIFKICFIWCY